jgi:hypothetical protein
LRTLIKAALAALCLIASIGAADAQYTPVTANTGIKMSGKLIPAGTVTFAPVDDAGLPIAFVTGGGGLNSPGAISCGITLGVLASNCLVPDAALTTPANIRYTIQITNTASQKTFVLNAVPNITGGSWALDAYAPPANTSNVQDIQVSYGTAAPPNPCVSPSFYVQDLDGGLLYMCVEGVPVLVTSSGNGSGGVGPVGPAGPTGATGATGPQGPTGPAGLNNRGVFSSTATYNTNDLVSYLGSAYVCIVSGTTGSPFADPSNWTLLVSEGPAGPTGPTGAQGPSGSGGDGTVTYGTTANTAAEGNDPRIVGAAQIANNLSDLANEPAARTNLGLGTAATTNSSAYDAAGAASAAESAAISVDGHCLAGREQPLRSHQRFECSSASGTRFSSYHLSKLIRLSRSCCCGTGSKSSGREQSLRPDQRFDCPHQSGTRIRCYSTLHRVRCCWIRCNGGDGGRGGSDYRQCCTADLRKRSAEWLRVAGFQRSAAYRAAASDSHR